MARNKKQIQAQHEEMVAKMSSLADMKAMMADRTATTGDTFVKVTLSATASAQGLIVKAVFDPVDGANVVSAAVSVADAVKIQAFGSALTPESTDSETLTLSAGSALSVVKPGDQVVAAGFGQVIAPGKDSSEGFGHGETITVG